MIRVFFAVIFSVVSYALAQQMPEKCATHTHQLTLLQQHPEINNELERINVLIQTLKANQPSAKNEQVIITIPVVVHVVYNTTVQNISDAQIQSQISALNKDFRKLNSDLLPSNHPFFSLIADVQIEFCLASVDPSGNATTGITRTNTSVSSFSDNDKVKSSTTGGANPWNTQQYLNLWVCNLGGSLLGYAQLPEDLSDYPETDGVVINYKYFGTVGTSTSPYNLGRTATHEIGHWLGLEHIWGDDTDCSGSDNIDDTPNQKTETYGCPAGIITDDCSPNSPGIMYQNYMDYTDDACMNMFTLQQATWMRGILQTIRSSIATSNKCSTTTAVLQSNSPDFSVYPNPVNRYVRFSGLPNSNEKFELELFSIDGKLLYTTSINHTLEMIELPELENGNYLVKLSNSRSVYVAKILVRK